MYHGKELQNGYCGIKLTGITGQHILGCRVRTAAAKSTWIYEKMMIYAHQGYRFVVITGLCCDGSVFFD